MCVIVCLSVCTVTIIDSIAADCSARITNSGPYQSTPSRQSVRQGQSGNLVSYLDPNVRVSDTLRTFGSGYGNSLILSHPEGEAFESFECHCVSELSYAR